MLSGTVGRFTGERKNLSRSRFELENESLQRVVQRDLPVQPFTISEGQ